MLLLVALCATAKKIKVSVSPATAKIYVDGSYYGEGQALLNIPKKEGFVVVRVEDNGYVPIETRIFSTDTRSAISFKLREDPSVEATTEYGNANKYFTVRVNKDLYKVDDKGKVDAELAWKMIHAIILNYFDEIQTSDMASGYVQTAWVYKTFPEAEKAIRTRVSVRETSLGGDLSFQIKISSQESSMRGRRNADNFKDSNRILKDVAPIISEFQSRLGKL